MAGQWISAILNILWSALTALGAIILAFVVLAFSPRKLPYAQIRGELLKLIRVIPLRPYELSTVLSGMENEKLGSGDEVMSTKEIVAQLNTDPAMHIYSAAQRILHCDV